MSMHDFDVVVVGAGPAGAIAARTCARAGLRVALFEDGRRGSSHIMETFPPSGAPLAESIGVLEDICALSHGPVSALHMDWRDAPERWEFGGAGPLIVPRRELHQMFRDVCLREDDVHLFADHVNAIETQKSCAKVSAKEFSIRTRLVLDARGRRSAGASNEKLVALPFVGSVGESAEHSMHLAALPNAWIWLCKLRSGDVHGTVFQYAGVLSKRSKAQLSDDCLECVRETEVYQKLENFEVLSPEPAAFSAVGDPLVSDQHILIGDAALARDPIASHGLVHAMRSGVQSGIAAATILDPSGDTRAAFEFLRIKHAQSVMHSKDATARAYSDQQKHTGPFWRAHNVYVAPSKNSDLSGEITLARPLTRAPVLREQRIDWAPAIERPSAHDFATHLGTVSVTEVAAACRPPAPLSEIAARLGKSHRAPDVLQALGHLVEGGAFAAAH